MYITYLEYTQLGKHPLPEFEFMQKEYEAERIVDDLTTGVDGFHKLQDAFPENDKDRRAVIMCMAALIAKMADIDDVRKTVKETGDGGVVASKSSGAESISYATAYISDEQKAATSETARTASLKKIARFWLYGVSDANGVNLLYGGPYV